MEQIVFAPAKVNLHLAVGDKAADGYHAVTTVLQALEFGDTVTVSPAANLAFSCTPNLDLPPERNLAYRAALAMSARFDRELEVDIAVEKTIPAGAGLGGASTDAAAVIFALARLWGVSDRAALASVARTLGADVPFFLEGGAALYTGRGDVLERRLPALDVAVAVLKPALPVPTAEAYAAFDALGATSAPSAEPLMSALKVGDAREAAALLYNGMTPASVTLVPEIARALDIVGSCGGVMGSAMAGSGSAVFGVFADIEGARACARAGEAAGLWAIAAHTASGGVRPVGT